jgi:hypothetical protein
MLAEARASPPAARSAWCARAVRRFRYATSAASLVTGHLVPLAGAAAALEEFRRVLAPGGWVALFWRATPRAAAVDPAGGGGARGVGVPMSHVFEEFRVHPADPFAGSGLGSEPPLLLHTVLSFTVEEFHGYVSTLEVDPTLRRDESRGVSRSPGRGSCPRIIPTGSRERNEEHLFLARRPA